MYANAHQIMKAIVTGKHTQYYDWLLDYDSVTDHSGYTLVYDDDIDYVIYYLETTDTPYTITHWVQYKEGLDTWRVSCTEWNALYFANLYAETCNRNLYEYDYIKLAHKEY